ncbi:MAG: carotenoid oxygenase, partial [Alphaproteobacteria bacterium]|nr:carotenoid oxygenase [Alphaproteobacteria bacterium]
MKGRLGVSSHPETVRRYAIDLDAKRVTEAVVSQDSYEFSIVDPRVVNHPHWIGYFAGSGAKTLDSIARVDMESGAKTAYRCPA